MQQQPLASGLRQRKAQVAVIGDTNLDAAALLLHKPEWVAGDEGQKQQLAEEVSHNTATAPVAGVVF